MCHRNRAVNTTASCTVGQCFDKPKLPPLELAEAFHPSKRRVLLYPARVEKDPWNFKSMLHVDGQMLT